MKPFIRLVFIWILSLSLTGLPVIAQSQDIAGLGQSGKDMMMTVSDAPADDMPCLHKAAQANLKAVQQTPEVKKVASNATTSDSCCCAGDCQCQYDMNCQTSSNSSASAIILQTTLFISSPLNSQLTTESVVLYHDCDTDSEVIPPIA